MARATISELSAQSMYGDADHLACGSIVVSPHMSCKRVRGHDRRGVTHQILEEAELVAGQTEFFLAIDLEGAGFKIQPQAADFEELLLLVGYPIELGPSRVRLDARDQLPMTEGFHDVVIRAGVEGTHLVVLVRTAGEDEDREGRAQAPEVSNQLEAVARTQVEVDDRDPGALAPQSLDGVGRLRRGHRDEAGLFHE